jgi:hypothetical protein
MLVDCSNSFCESVFLLLYVLRDCDVNSDSLEFGL